jgi:adenosylcobinamide-GDP ribazoletransferase
VIRRQFHAAINAVQFLTRVPLPGGMNRPDPDCTLLRVAVVYFPLVGGLVGAFTGLVVWAALLVWPPVIAVTFALVIEALLTGAFHEDAVADCCDAFGGGWSRDDVLRILKDSRVGSFGALGLTLAVLVRGGCMMAVPPSDIVMTMAASAAVGRWAIVLLMLVVPPVPNREGLSKDVGTQMSGQELIAATLWTLPGVLAFGWCQPLRFVLGTLAVIVLMLAWASYVRHRIGGMTGDCLGCGCYLAQCVVLLAATARGLG